MKRISVLFLSLSALAACASSTDDGDAPSDPVRVEAVKLQPSNRCGGNCTQSEVCMKMPSTEWYGCCTHGAQGLECHTTIEM